MLATEDAAFSCDENGLLLYMEMVSRCQADEMIILHELQSMLPYARMFIYSPGAIVWLSRVRNDICAMWFTFRARSRLDERKSKLSKVSFLAFETMFWG